MSFLYGAKYIFSMIMNDIILLIRVNNSNKNQISVIITDIFSIAIIVMGNISVVYYSYDFILSVTLSPLPL